MGRAGTNTREKLVETAMDLIWQSGYASVSVDDICKASGVKKGSFYHYFPSKVDLAIAAMDEAYNRFRPLLDEVFSPSLPALERFVRYVDQGYQAQKDIAEQYGRVCGCPFVTLGSEMAPQEESIRIKTDDIIESHKRYYENALRDLVSEGLLPSDTDIKAKASNLYAFVMGQLVMARIQNSLEPMERDLKTGLMRMLDIKQVELEDA